MGDRPLPGKSQLAIGFLIRRSGMDPVEKQLDPRVQLLLEGGTYGPPVKYGEQNKPHPDPHTTDGIYWIRACRERERERELIPQLNHVAVCVFVILPHCDVG